MTKFSEVRAVCREAHELIEGGKEEDLERLAHLFRKGSVLVEEIALNERISLLEPDATSV